MTQIMIGVLTSVFLIGLGLTVPFWFWLLPPAKKLRSLANNCQLRPVKLIANEDYTTGVFIDRHASLANRIRIIHRLEMAQDYIGDMQTHFCVFVIGYLMFIVTIVIKSSEKMGKIEMQHAAQSNGSSQTISESADELIGYISDMWVAPVIEAGLFFMVLYAIFMLLKDLSRLHRAKLD